METDKKQRRKRSKKREYQVKRRLTAEQHINNYYPQAHSTDHPMTSNIDHHIITEKKKKEKD